MPNVDPGPFGLPTQNPEPKPLKYCFFEGVRKYSYLFSPFFLPSPNFRIDRTEKMSHLLMLCTPKFYPFLYTPNILSFFPVDTRRVEKMHILCRRPCIYIYIIMCVYIYIYVIIEGSLEAKLPTIWTDEKQSREEAERRDRSEEKRSEERRCRCAKR